MWVFSYETLLQRQNKLLYDNVRCCLYFPRYDALRENLLAEMLKIQVGEGMWAAFPEKEQHDRLLQLKVKEEKLRRDGKLETMAPSLPGARHQFNYSLLWAMGESQADSDKRSKAMKEKEKESGKSK